MRLPSTSITLLILLLGAAAPAAQASTISTAGGVLRVQAAAGEANAIEITREEAAVVVTDDKARAAGVGCRARSAKVVACSPEGIAAIEVQAGDKDDSVRIADGLAATIVGGPGEDRLTGGAGDDRIEGSDGDDVLEGGAGADRLSGGTGADLVAGGSGNDLLRGETGADDLHGEEGDDTLLAGSGDDLLDGGAGLDRLLGEAGADTAVSDEGEPDSIACGPGRDDAQVDPGDTVIECERLRGPGGSVLRLTPALAPAPAVALTPLTPFPVVRIVGAVTGSRTRLSRVIVNAPDGSRIESRCSGPGCPYKSRITTLPRGGGRVALRGLQRRFRAGVTLEVFVTREGKLGKYASFKIRRGRAPQRTDLCLRAEALRSVKCAG